MTEKENYLRMLRGEIPEWVPQYTFGKMPGSDYNPANVMLEPDLLIQHRKNKGGKDIWGVNYVATYETGEALIPEPNNFILDDITKWRDVIKAPDISGIDWEAMVKKDIEDSRIDRTQSAMALNLHFGYFQNIVSYMGFEGAMMAMAEDPEEVHALLDYIADFYIEVAKNTIDLYNPDICTFMDDTAAWGSPFISPGMYREFLLPRHKRWADMAAERGKLMTMHNCGKCESIIDQLVEIGINMWEPAQTCNDLVAVKKKYDGKDGRKRLAIGGGWDGRGRLLEPDVTDEELIASVHATIDSLAPDGGFAWCGGFLGAIDDKEVLRKNMVVMGEVTRYGHEFYKK
ncbi:MAG: veratrol--corrinoid protein metyltransferase [Oscillospiraceae bacterium]|nr:veratrol--corrinoid protein metyltransferase [Oscillospiraceae bacterium]